MWTQSHWLWAGIYISINLYTASCALFQEFKDPWTDWHKYWQRPRFYNTTSERKTPRLCDNGIKITEQKAKVYWGEPNNSVPYNKWQCLHEKCEVLRNFPSLYIYTTSFYNKESFNFDTLLMLFIDLFRKWRFCKEVRLSSTPIFIWPRALKVEITFKQTLVYWLSSTLIFVRPRAMKAI